MRVIIRTTSHLAWSTEVDAPEGDAARRIWRDIDQGTPVRASVAESGDEVVPGPVWLVFNPAQVLFCQEQPG
ncbi:MAG: hypothetical protein QOD44_2825 [Solirubrobacteraceae bacterium]|jgi:hypothetical protein|nr:hypothetical protein [Solirubrobacteraceae bacterium]